MGSENIKLTFYTVTTPADGTATETVLHADIPGTLETDRQILSEKVTQASFIQLLYFLPSKILSGVLSGMIAKNGTTTYKVQYVETYFDHQEIYLRKNNL
jgi:hypothetical protein